MVPLPGRPMPIASVRQFIEFAVNMPAQLPHVGQALLELEQLLLGHLARAYLAHRGEHGVEVDGLALQPRPASIGPPVTTTVGISSRAAAMSMPGMILSQLGISTSASNACAVTAISTESAISSRLASEYLMPSWPMAMPSHTPMVEISIGVPPAMRMPVFTASAILSSMSARG